MAENVAKVATRSSVPAQRDRRSTFDTVRDFAAPTALPRMQPWRATYARVLLLGDLLVLVSVMATAQFLRFGFESASTADVVVPLSYGTTGLLIAITWWLSLQIFRTRSPHIFGHGTEEYRRVIRATVATFGSIATASLMLKADASRGYLAFAFPLGLIGLIAWRKVLRVILHRRRRAGHAISRVLLIGSPAHAESTIAALGSNPASGYQVTGVWSPRVVPESAWLGLQSSRVPVFDSRRRIQEVLSHCEAEVVMVTDSEHLGHDGLRELTWKLDERGIELMVSPSVLNVAPSRLYMHDVSGMSLLQVDPPQYAGATRFAKSFFDRAGAAMILLVASPILLVTAALVKLTSRGPVFYRQERIGRDGLPFGMIKFRSMKVGADAELVALLAAEGKTLAELPKLTVDPRVTKVGRVIRRYSIDELPQLINVIKGDMSLVGPRPQRDFEVEQYDHVAQRRLTVRPGMTGLWQVSGRSDLSFEDAIKLDVHYVENWAMTTDLVILWKTLRAVVASDGAY